MPIESPAESNDEGHILRQAVETAFPDHDPAPLLSALMRYGEQPYHNETLRVRLAIVQLCDGDVAQLPVHLAIALDDYRDVLAAVSRPRPSAEQAASEQQAVRELLARWGRQD